METIVSKTESAATAAKSRVLPGLSRRAALWLEIAALVIAVVCLFLVDGCMLVSQRQTIFPNVSVMGVKLSGKNVSEATAALRLAGWDGADGVVLRAEFPGDAVLNIRSGAAGWSASAREAAQAAWDHGRTGSHLCGLMTYLGTLLTGYDAGDALCGAPDVEPLRQQTDQATEQANRYLENGYVDGASSKLYLVKGGSEMTLDPDTVFAQVQSALARRDQTLSFLRVPNAAETPDWQALHDRLCHEAQNAYYNAETDSIEEGWYGVSFSVDAAKRLWEQAQPGDTVEIPVTLTEPDYWSGDLNGLYADQLSVKTTYLGGSTYNRVRNVTLAAERINGVVLKPGESFSYNDVVGQRTREAGFLEAGAYADGEVVQEVGGGICQVSSTLYYCAMTANLNILARTNHYFAVNYIEPGMDATVSWGGPEFVFENNRDFPVVIRAGVSGGALTVELWGTDTDGSTVRMSYSQNGKNVTTFRAVYDRDGNLLSNEFEAASTYHSH